MSVVLTHAPVRCGTWDAALELPLIEARAKYESGDIPLEVIEARPADEKIKLGVNGRDSDGWINERNEQADFEMWSRHPEAREPIRRQFLSPKYPRSSQ